MRLSRIVAIASLIAALAIPKPVAQAQSTGLVTFLNNTSTPLTFSVDDVGYTCRVGVQYGSCSARAAVGGHTLYAKYDSGRVAVTRSIELSADGFTWTIYEEK
jgi:hypothetical protein